MRSDWFNNRLRLNPTLFWTKYDDKQEAVSQCVADTNCASFETLVENAAGADINGFELEFQALLSDQLTLRTNIGYIDGDFTSYEVPDLQNPGTTIDVKNQKNLIRTPTWTVATGLDYTLLIDGNSDLVFSGSYYSISDDRLQVNRDYYGRDQVDGYHSVDLSMSYNYEGSSLPGKFTRLSVGLWGKDILAKDDGRIANTLDAGLFYLNVTAPRKTFGIDLIVEF
tara:strand:- start:4940 stop:5614 length:675 start_codon:yes stop_codon:yes gene_type:complete